MLQTKKNSLKLLLRYSSRSTNFAVVQLKKGTSAGPHEKIACKGPVLGNCDYVNGKNYKQRSHGCRIIATKMNSRQGCRAELVLIESVHRLRIENA